MDRSVSRRPRSAQLSTLEDTFDSRRTRPLHGDAMNPNTAILLSGITYHSGVVIQLNA